jgi:hypothetical protein
MGDESDWVDEDDDDIPYAPGLGQMPLSAGGVSKPKAGSSHMETVQLSPPPRGHRTGGSNRATSSKGASSSSASSSSSGMAAVGRKAGGRASPVLTESTFEVSESRSGRRQIPGSRAGNAFKEGIMEEDEEEE